MRIAIVSTPRSGNTWVRHLLAKMYNLAAYAEHAPHYLQWDQLKKDSIVQFHWHCTAEFKELLEKYQFRVLTLSRHPLDVLVSILHFATNKSQTFRWLAGEGGNEYPIYEKSVVSQEFLDYCVSERAKALLGVSREWWTESAFQVHYEDVVADPCGTLRQLAAVLGPVVEPIENAVAQYTMDKLRPLSSNGHFWKGQPGLWKTLFPQAAEKICAVHSRNMTTFGYQCVADNLLTVDQAQQHWDACR